MMNRDELVKELENGVKTVTFTKADGTERVMKATLLGEYVQPLMSGKQVLVDKPVNESVIRCIDTEKNEWRSFRMDSIKSVL